MLLSIPQKDLPSEVSKDFWANTDTLTAGPDGLVAHSSRFSTHYASVKKVKGYSDVELLAKVKIDTTAYKQGLLVIRGNVYYDENKKKKIDSGYVLALQEGGGSMYMKVDKAQGEFSDAILVPFPTEWNWYRFSAKGSTIKAKFWRDGYPEPAWQIVMNDNTWRSDSNGSVGIAHFSGGNVTYNYIAASTENRPAPLPGEYANTYVNPRPEPELGYWGAPGLRPLGAILPVKNIPKVYALAPQHVTEHLTISRPALTVEGPKYNLKGTRGWVHLVFKEPQPKLTYIPPKPGELRPVQVIERLTIRPPTLTHTGPVYALRASRTTERVNISSPTLTAHTAALIQPEGVDLRVGISSPNVIFIPKPEVLELRPSPILARLTIMRTNNLLDPSVYNIEYKQYKPDYVGVKAYEGETLNIDRYRPGTIETGKIDSIELNTNRYKRIVIK